MLYVNYQDMSRVILQRRGALPDRIDMVAGIPRSGIVPATMIATMLNAPLTDTESLIEGKLYGHGYTKNSPDIDRALAPGRTVLVIDDAVGSGRTFREVQEKFAAAELTGNFVYCAIYAPARKHPDVDIVLRVVPPGPLFQWNVMHHRILAKACVDIDGVLCCNPMPQQDDDGRAYESFLDTTSVLHKTSGEIGWLVTSRLEKYRANTEDWLARNGIIYRELIMAVGQEDHENSSQYKARVYSRTGAELFIVSEAEDAERICSLSNLPVLSIATQRIILPETMPGMSVNKVLSTRSLTRRRRIAKAKFALRRIIGNKAYWSLKKLARRDR